MLKNVPPEIIVSHLWSADIKDLDDKRKMMIVEKLLNSSRLRPLQSDLPEILALLGIRDFLDLLIPRFGNDPGD